ALPAGLPLAGPAGLPGTAAALPSAPYPVAAYPASAYPAPPPALPRYGMPYAAAEPAPARPAVSYPATAVLPAAPVGLPPLPTVRPPNAPAAPLPGSAMASLSPLEQQLQTLRAEFSGNATGGALARQRDGESGMSGATTVELPLEA